MASTERLDGLHSANGDDPTGIGATNGHLDGPNRLGPPNNEALPARKKKKKKRFRCRAAWVSDLHIGTHMFRALLFLAFIRILRCEKLYVNGDFLDVEEWAGFPQEHVDVIQKLLRKARKGMGLVCLAGNHDIAIWNLLRHWFGRRSQFRVGKNIVITREAVHITADGRKMMVLHGDQFDAKLKIPRWLERLGNRGYYFSMWLDRHVNDFLRRIGCKPRDIAGFLKRMVKRAIQHVANFKTLLIGYAREKDAAIVSCGHIHTAEIRLVDGVLYVNSGAWVTEAYCTFLAEGEDGKLTLYRWDGEDVHVLAREEPVPGAMSSV